MVYLKPKENTKQRRDMERDIRAHMRAVRNCKHTETETIIVPPSEHNGIAIDGGEVERCTFCKVTLGLA